MTGSTSCIFCRTLEDRSGAKLVNNCDLSDGDPCSACKDYLAIEVEISAARQTLQDLILKRAEIGSRVNQNHDALASRVPEEIVRSVFQFCLSPANWDSDVFQDHGLYEKDSIGYSDEFGEDDRAMLSAPLLLGSICKTWRKIAWASEPLWTVFRLYLEDAIDDDSVTLAREWLERAGQFPLSIRVSYPRWRVADDNADTKLQLLGLVNERSQQWRNLDVLGHSWLISRVKGDSGGAPNLQTLRIGRISRDDGIPFSLMETRPRPSQLSLHNCSLDSIHVEWTSLRTVFLSRPSLDDAIGLLRLAPSVVSYKLYEIKGATNTHTRTNPHDTSIYQSLESLEICCSEKHQCQAREIVLLFEAFLFPNLKHLKLESNNAHVNADRAPSWDPVILHLEKSSPPLTSLSILHLSEKPFSEFIIPVLQATPLVRDLEVFIPFWTWSIMAPHGQPFIKQEIIKFLQLLADTSISETKILPDLQSIKFLLEMVNEADENGFWEHIPAIFGPISDIHNPRRRPLKTLTVQFTVGHFFGINSDDVASQLLRLQEEGIDLNFRTLSGRDAFDKVMKKRGKDANDSD